MCVSTYTVVCIHQTKTSSLKFMGLLQSGYIPVGGNDKRTQVCLCVSECVSFTGVCCRLEVLQVFHSAGSEQHVLVVYCPLATAVRFQLIV